MERGFYLFQSVLVCSLPGCAFFFRAMLRQRGVEGGRGKYLPGPTR